MKKIIVFIVALAILVGTALGIMAVVKSCQSKDDGKNITHRVDLIKDEYTVGEKVIFRVIATANVNFTKLTYSLNNEDEVELSVTAGQSVGYEEAIGTGKYFIDSGAKIIETTDRESGYYTLVIYAYDADEIRYELTADPIVFRLRAATAAEYSSAPNKLYSLLGFENLQQ